MPQRRARRCSRSDAVASFSMTSRSQLASAIVLFLHYDLAVTFLDRHGHQPAFAGSAEAAAGLWRVDRAVRRAYQKQPFAIEELPRLPVELHRHVRAAIQIGVHPALVSDRERRLRISADAHLEAHAVARIDQVRARADYAFSVSHARSSSVLPTQPRGRCASRLSRG